jgi:hypothetical protein
MPELVLRPACRVSHGACTRGRSGNGKLGGQVPDGGFVAVAAITWQVPDTASFAAEGETSVI